MKSKEIKVKKDGDGADVEEGGLEYTLAKIRETALLKEKIHKKLGVGADSSEAVPNDMYLFEYSKPESNIKQRIILHGKCILEAQNRLVALGNKLIRIGHFKFSDKNKAGTRCAHCKDRLDESAYTEKIKNRDIRLAEEKIAYTDWIQEQILLGKR